MINLVFAEAHRATDHWVATAPTLDTWVDTAPALDAAYRLVEFRATVVAAGTVTLVAVAFDADTGRLRGTATVRWPDPARGPEITTDWS